MGFFQKLDRLSGRALLLLAGGLFVALFLLRGCLLAQKEPKNAGHGGVSSDSGVTLSVYDHREDSISQMELEDYILHVVAGEMPASFSMEALKSQAVAARTFTVRRLAKYGGSPCEKADICTNSACCQAYKSDARMWEDWGQDYDEKLARVAAAVEATAGLVALYDGEPIEALYHSTSGGRTENAENVFSDARPYLVSVESPGEEIAPRFEQSVSFTKRAFCKTVNAQYDAGLSARRLHKQVEVEDRYESGRVERVRLGEATLTGRELRSLFGLASANFSFEFSDSEVNISTRGYGHGVGLSQYGAEAMARAGAGYEAILKHYYTGIELKDIRELER